MNGVPNHLAYYKGVTGKNRRKKLKEWLREAIPDKQQYAAVKAIMDEYAVLYLIQHTEHKDKPHEQGNPLNKESL